MDNADTAAIEALGRMITSHGDTLREHAERITAGETNLRNFINSCNERYGSIQETLRKQDDASEKILKELKDISIQIALNSGKGIFANHFLTYGLMFLSSVVAYVVGISHGAVGSK